MFYSPLDQFELYPVIKFSFFKLTAVLGNFDIYFIFFILLILFFLTRNNIYYVIPSNFQILLETIFEGIFFLVFVNAGRLGQYFYVFFCTLTTVLLFFNVFGLLPFGFTLTSHLAITLFLSYLFFVTINVLGILKHRWKMFGLFLPSGTPLIIVPMIVFIELVSYIARMFSLAIRLFANMLAGHTLLFILISFLFAGLQGGSFVFCIDVLAFFFVHLIAFMEIAIAFLQVYVFLILSCFYLRDIEQPSH